MFLTIMEFDSLILGHPILLFFFFNDPPPTEIYPLSLPDPLPIWADYDRFRLRSPPALIEDLCRRAAVTGAGRLLDLACGPGTVTFALCDRFAEVCAVDLEPDEIGRAHV